MGSKSSQHLNTRSDTLSEKTLETYHVLKLDEIIRKQTKPYSRNFHSGWTSNSSSDLATCRKTDRSDLKVKENSQPSQDTSKPRTHGPASDTKKKRGAEPRKAPKEHIRNGIGLKFRRVRLWSRLFKSRRTGDISDMPALPPTEAVMMSSMDLELPTRTQWQSKYRRRRKRNYWRSSLQIQLDKTN
jgi:hypothetical protein